MPVGFSKASLVNLLFTSATGFGGSVAGSLFARKGVEPQQLGGGVRHLVLPNLEGEAPQEGAEEEFEIDDEDSEPAFNQLQIDMNNNRQEEEEPEDPREVEKRRRNELEKERQRKELEDLKLKWEARSKNLERKKS